MMITRKLALLLPSVLLACQIGDGTEPYYGEGTSPTLTGLDVKSEVGNIGGGTVTLTGANFGGDPSMVTVVFGSQNARILDVSDDAITVEVPRGPIEGGAVDIKVGTPEGQVVAEDAYTYDVGGFYSDEIAYIAITNDYFSCFGGIGHPSGDCADWAISGPTGLDGRSEFLDFLYPRVHAPWTGERSGFGGAADMASDGWRVEMPAQDINTLDLENLYQDLRVEVDDFTITNLSTRGAYSDEERMWCQDMSGLASFGNTGVPGSFLPEADCDAPAAKEYDLTEVRYCQVESDNSYYEMARSYVWKPDWPVGEYFFYGTNPAGNPSDDYGPDIELSVPELGLEGVTLTLPEYSTFYGTTGFNYSEELLGMDPDDPSTQTLDLIVGFKNTCPDSNGDGVTTGEDVAATWEWEPIQTNISASDYVKDVQSYVRVSITLMREGWLGASGAVTRATITVPDEYNMEGDHSVLEMPASVLYQFPSAMQDKGSWFILDEAPMGHTGYAFNAWGSPERSNYGFMFSSIERITEYRIPTTMGGDLVLSYSTGDVGYLAYPLHTVGYGSEDDGTDGYTYMDNSWVNPALDGDGCHNCLDDDGDGWTDQLDPDCRHDLDGNGMEELGYSDYTCNDNIDNDGDGRKDANDPDCESGVGSEGNCFDGEDNDEDGWVDLDDPDCTDGTGSESGYNEALGCNDREDNDADGWIDAGDPDCETPESTEEGPNDDYACADGLDNDDDGWVDWEDPDCLTGADEELGLGTTACNDGADNDGHGDVDADDYLCAVNGALHDREDAYLIHDCADSVDNDSDGFIDAGDPDCEIRPFDTEDQQFWAEDSQPLIPTCYNGDDDDGDGNIDALDTDCLTTEGVADGFYVEPGEAR